MRSLRKGESAETGTNLALKDEVCSPPMTPTEKTELSLIPLLAGLTWLAAPLLPHQISVGTALVWASAMVLLQGLVRDLWLLAKARRAARVDVPRKARCMCVESTVGVTGIVAGIVLLGAGIDRTFIVSRRGWGLAVVAVLGVGFELKDYVFEWRPFRLRRDKDHLNIVFSWRA